MSLLEHISRFYSLTNILVGNLQNATAIATLRISIVVVILLYSDIFLRVIVLLRDLNLPQCKSNWRSFHLHLRYLKSKRLDLIQRSEIAN